MNARATYDDLLTRVAALVAALDRPPIVAISGHGGAGKSTLSTRLIRDLGGEPKQIVRTDRFYAAGAGPDSGLFELHDWARLTALLERLKREPTLPRLTHPVRTYEGIERIHDVPMPPTWSSG